MRRRRLLILLCAALALSACARQVPRYAAAPQGAIASSELDVRMYGAPQPQSYAVQRARQAVPQPVGPVLGLGRLPRHLSARRSVHLLRQLRRM